MMDRAGLESARQTFGRKPETTRPDTANDVRREFAEWIGKIGRVLKLRPTVVYVSSPDATFVAQCTPSRENPTVMINTSYCPDAWLAQRGPEQMELVIHELAHAMADSPMEHGPGWGDACALAGAKVANAIARKELIYDPGERPRGTHRPLASPLKAAVATAA